MTGDSTHAGDHACTDPRVIATRDTERSSKVKVFINPLSLAEVLRLKPAHPSTTTTPHSPLTMISGQSINLLFSLVELWFQRWPIS